MPTSAVTPYINVARIVRVHGKSGEVVVAPLDGLPFCLWPEMSVCLTPPELTGPRFREVLDVREHNGQALVLFDGVESISDAEGLVGKLVLAAREDVPEAVFEQDVLSCAGRVVVDERHGEIGTIAEVMQLPANDVWRIEGPFGELFVPVIEQVVGTSIAPEGPIAVRLLPGIIDEGEGL